jgi:hypothetical protein
VLVLLSVVMVSAVVRLHLYVSAFGLTVDRFYAAAGLLYLALMFGWFAWTALRGQAARFVFGAAMLALGWLGTLHAINPDAFIARYNLARADGPAFDAKYVAQLSSDAAPELVMALERFGGDASPASCAIAARLDTWLAAPRDWRTWNLAATRAGRMSRSALRGSCEPVAQPEPPGD